MADTGGASPTVIGLVAASALLAGAALVQLARRRTA
ncbi:MAG: LPXTG cell wall anchor domain-containing protein [Ilumatobacteraceae bacterium]